MTDLTEQDIYTAFGIEPTEEPAVDPAGQGGEFPGSANETSPSSDELTETSRDSASDGDAAEPKAEPEEDPEKKPELTTEERRANAARRREKERKEAIDAAVAAERDRIYREMGYKDAADYRAQRAEEQANLRQRAMKRMGLTAEEGEALFGPAAGVGREENPQEYSPQADIPQTGRPEADLSEEPFEGGADALDRQIAEISKLDPSIKSLEDLQAKPWAAEMAQALNARQFGTDENRLLRAYKVFAQEDIIQARLAEARKAGRQEALNQQAGKEHLAPAKERAGQGLPDVPKATLAAYKQLMPGKTYDEYQREYAKTLKATR